MAGSSSNAIPTRVRQVVRERDGGHCLRCGAAGTQVHHRRRRGVRDGHQHGYENCVSLCHVCHAWVHAHPIDARDAGLIVSMHELDVQTIVLMSYMGPITLEADGGIRWAQ